MRSQRTPQKLLKPTTLFSAQIHSRQAALLSSRTSGFGAPAPPPGTATIQRIRHKTPHTLRPHTSHARCGIEDCHRRIAMKKNKVDPEPTNCKEVQPCPKDELNDDDYRLELAIALRRKYAGRWAAERWLLHRYLCFSFLVCWFRAAKAAKKDPGAPPF